MIKRSFVTLALVTSGAAVFAAPAPVLDVNSGSLENRVTALERIVNSRTDAQHRIQEQLDTMQSEVNELRGTLETHTYQLEQILQRQRELYQEIDRRIEEVTASKSSAVNSPVSMPVATPAPGSTTTKPATTATGTSDADAYDSAVNLILKDKKYDEAIPAFERFIQQYPDSSYGANAYYWLGQLLFNKGDLKGSQDKFTRLVNNYADSTKRADSLLKLGMIAQKQNDSAAARQYFQRVISEYAQSSAARLAEGRLKSLN